VRKLIIAALVFILTLFGAVRLSPEIAADVLLGVYHWTAGLEQKKIQTEFGDVSYLEGGQGTPIVFLHGVFARKEHWINMVGHMEQGNRVILLDLPGFGENNMLPISSYKYGAQVDNVKSVLDALQLSTFHIVGSSMGAQIAAEIARDWSDRVISLALIGSPTGVDTPQKTPFQQQRLADQANLVVTDRASYDARNALLFPDKPFPLGR
jgi:pimeloyl-ACP methyl ester carboxylesterase